MLSLLRQYPGSIGSANAGYRQQLCSQLCVAPPSSLTQFPAGADATAMQSADSAAAAQPAVAVAEASITAECVFEPQQGGKFVVRGAEFVAQFDLYVQRVAEPVNAAAAIAEQTASDAAKAVAKAKADAAAAVMKAAADAAAAAVAAAAAAAEEAKPSKGGKDAKSKPAAALKPKEADKGGKPGKGGKADKPAAAPDAPAELPQPEFEFEFGGVKAPQDGTGMTLCHEDAVPEGVIRQVLQVLQTKFLEDMVTFCEEAESDGHSWAGEEEVAATEQLEARLRSHRYRQFWHLFAHAVKWAASLINVGDCTIVLLCLLCTSKG